jgi:16S rRNA (adenine1518-N6/adenine1519-N6)-dimethyltransferase
MSRPPPAAPKRSLGQVFLNSESVVRRIARALDAGPDDTVIEVGPGRGAMTGVLAASCGRLVLIEKDSDLAVRLAERFAADARVRVIEADATSLDLDEAVPDDGRPLRVAGNLPYNAGGPILFNLLRRCSRVRRMVLMFQREVAVRIAARPGDREHGALAVMVQARAMADRLFDVSPSRFVPQPRVWSAVVRIDPRPLDHPAAAGVDDPAFERLVHALFAQPRKTVVNSLADGLGVAKEDAAGWLAAAGIDATIRPALVTTTQALDLFAAWKRDAL